MIVESVWPWWQRQPPSSCSSRRFVQFDPHSETKIPRTNLGALCVVVCVRGCGEVSPNDFDLERTAKPEPQKTKNDDDNNKEWTLSTCADRAPVELCSGDGGVCVCVCVCVCGFCG